MYPPAPNPVAPSVRPIITSRRAGGVRLRLPSHAPSMPGENEKGRFSADIPADAVEEALRSVEKRAPSAAAEPQVEVEPPAAAEDLGARVARLEAELELSQQKGRETMERLREEHDRFLRAAADLENTRKRAQRERDEVQRFGNERLLKDLIPVLDNLERALAAAAADDPLSGGVRLVLRGLEEALGRYGVKAFSAMGQPFDPRLHEALLQIPAEGGKAPGTVVLEHGRGFLLNDRLVRPAMVGVAVAAAAPAASPADGEGPTGPAEGPATAGGAAEE